MALLPRRRELLEPQRELQLDAARAGAPSRQVLAAQEHPREGSRAAAWQAEPALEVRVGPRRPALVFRVLRAAPELQALLAAPVLRAPRPFPRLVRVLAPAPS
jgi:hypothetical protein